MRIARWINSAQVQVQRVDVLVAGDLVGDVLQRHVCHPRPSSAADSQAPPSDSRRRVVTVFGSYGVNDRVDADGAEPGGAVRVAVHGWEQGPVGLRVPSAVVQRQPGVECAGWTSVTTTGAVVPEMHDIAFDGSRTV